MTQATVLNPHFTAFMEGYSRDRAVTVLRMMGAQSAVCVNDWELARAILQAGGTPILRSRAPFDDDADSHIDPVEYVDTINTELHTAEAGIPGAALRGIVHIGNELGSTQPRRTDDWLTAAIRRATQHKRKAVAANWSVFNPAPHMHAALLGTYAAIRANGGWMGYHEGTLVVPETGEVIKSITTAIQRGAIGGYRAAADRYGFKVMVTEFAASLTPNDGWSTWMDAREFADLCDAAARLVYAPDGVQVHVFTAFKWDRGRGFEYADNASLQLDFRETNRRYPVNEQAAVIIDPPTEGAQRVRVNALPAGLQWRNIRSQPNGAAQDLGDLKVGDEIDLYLQRSDGWAYLSRPLDGVKGWALMTGVEAGAVTIPPPTGTVTLTPEQYGRLQGILSEQLEAEKAVAAANAKLRAWIEEVAPPVLPGGF